MKIQITRLSQNRRGFTLVELLVAAALSILIMAVISTAFQTGLATLSTLKSLGDMAERLKTADTLLRSDLEAEHFATVDGAVGTVGDGSPGALHVSDLRYNLVPPSANPLGGYFQIFQGMGSNSGEGNDADGLLSSSADGTRGHRISITGKRNGKTPDQLFTAQITNPADLGIVSAMNVSDVTTNASTANSRWAQVDWFLDQSRPAVVNGVTTWPLIRRVRPIIEDSSKIVTLTSNASAELVSMTPTNQVNTLRTIAIPANRAPATSIPISDARHGDDIVITNVTSFEVRPMYSGIAYTSPDGVFADLPGPFPAQFDTGLGSTIVNNRIRVIAVQVKIRVYDTKNKLSRQTTLVVKL